MLTLLDVVLLIAMSQASSTSWIKTENSDQSVSAFTGTGELVMNFGHPYVAWGFSVRQLEEWLITLEELVDHVPSAHRHALWSLQASLAAAHDRHRKEHEQVVTEAPTPDDLMTYLAAYAASISHSPCYLQ